MQHIFLLSKEGFNYFNTQIYNIINDMVLNTDNMYYISNLSLKKRLTKNTFNNVKSFNISLPKLGMLTYFLYDFLSLYRVIFYIMLHKLDNSSIILFSDRIGLILPFIKPVLKAYNISISVYCEKEDLQFNKLSRFLFPLFNASY